MNWTHIAGLISIALFLLVNVILLFKKHESFFNLRTVISDHLSLFRNCKIQYVIFYVNPAFFAIGLSLIYEAGEAFYTNLSVIISILVSMLFAILSILTGKDYSSVPDNNQRNNIQDVTQETITAIVFETLLCIFLLLYGLTMIVIHGSPFNVDIANRVFSGIAYYTFAVILLNLLLIVKRISRITEYNLNIQREKEK